VYKLFSKIVDLADKEWLAVLGVASDYAFDDCVDMLKKWTEAKTREELLTKTNIGKAAIEISNALFELGFDKVVSILDSAKGFEDVMENQEIKVASEKYQKLYDECMKEFWDKSQKIGRVIFSTINPPHEGMGSGIVNRVSRENPDKLIFLFEDMDDKYDIDARFQGEGVHLGKLMEKLVGGGGHRNAAGGIVAKNDLKPLKKRILKELGVA
jgi:oligoribonuclease NrnB/cAMP/cGMP phosphodiesterase (DHH superfamily)